MSNNLSTPSAYKGGGGPGYKLPGPSGPEGGPGSDYVAYVFVFIGIIIICRLYKLTLSDQAQVTLQLRVSVFLI
jgi:hypothetical protein